MMRMISVPRKGEAATKSMIKKEVKMGTIPQTMDNVFFLGKSTTSCPITSVVPISTNPISKFMMPKLYPISLMAYWIPQNVRLPPAYTMNMQIIIFKYFHFVSDFRILDPKLQFFLASSLVFIFLTINLIFQQSTQLLLLILAILINDRIQSSSSCISNR